MSKSILLAIGMVVSLASFAHSDETRFGIKVQMSGMPDRWTQGDTDVPPEHRDGWTHEECVSRANDLADMIQRNIASANVPIRWKLTCLPVPGDNV